ncbi:MAG: nucleotidyltransferase domain-containing protein [Rhodococcus sp. (in: high G+C Gram-positive bacteria)]
MTCKIVHRVSATIITCEDVKVVEKLKAEELDLPIDLAELRELLDRYGASSAWVFGSYSRGEQHADSDLDLLVEMDELHRGG